MNKITFPLKLKMKGPAVADLQAALQLLKLKTQIVDPEGFFGSTTLLAVQEFQKRHGLEATGIVDPETARLINNDVDEVGAEHFVVRGEVRQADGDPLRAIIVRVFRKGLRKDDLLSQTTTAATGSYSVEYQPAEKPISLVIQASDKTGKVIATSPVICKARPLEVVNLTSGGVFRGPSEFKQLQERLAPILKREQIRIEALEAADVELLACAHDLKSQHVTLLVASSRMAREAGMEAEAFYALVRQGLPTGLIALVAQSPEVLQRAIKTSVRENIVGAQIGDALLNILRDLQGQIVRLALEEPTPDRPTFRTLLDIAGVSQQRQQTIIATYVEREGTVAEFWERLRTQHGMGVEEIETVQYTVGAAAIALNHPPLVRELARMRRAGQLGRSLRDLARFNRDDWERLIKAQTGGARIGAPALLGEKEEEREARYAEFLPRMVEALFPTAVLTHRLAEIDQRAFAPTLEFLRRNPEFDFRTMRAHEFMRDHPNALDGAADREATVKQLRAVQRMTNIAPNFNKAKTVALIAKDIDSAFKIRRMGAARFIRTRAEELGGDAAAAQVYTNAARQSDTALLLLSQSKVFNPTSPGILAPHLFGEGVPDLEDLFGSLDLCQCKHCASVYSPAAYLVDILHFLMNRPAVTGNRTALDVLFGDPADATRRRRWDVGAIELTCHNTNTEMPHVDLVNEILEHTIAPSGGFPFQTEGDAGALAASPEHINEAAYNILRNAVYPWSLPFDLWAAESRRYLAELGVRRDTLMEHFRREGAGLLPIDVAAEYLGLTPREREIITGAATETTRQMWGMEAVEFDLLLDERRAAVVLERSGLSYEEMVELLNVHLVDPGGTMRVQFAGADCNLATATITGLSTTGLNRMHRFARLQRKLGWPAAELGMTLAGLGVSSLNDEALVQLAQVKRLRETLKTSLETMLTWWSARLATQVRDGQPSLYDRIFNDPTVNPPELDIFRLKNARNELADSSRLIGDHAAAVHVALGISADDLAALRAEELSDDSLNLVNLTRLYKAVTLAKALEIAAHHYVTLRALTGINPFNAVVDTDHFARQARFVEESGFELTALDYLLRHRITSPAAMASDQISEFLGKLRAGLEQIAADHAISHDPSGARTAEKLELILPDDIVNRAIALINGTSAENQTSQTALLNDHFKLFLDPVEALQRLVSPGTLVTPESRFNYVLERLLNHLSRVASESLVIESLAGALGLDSAVTEQLLRELVLSPANPNQTTLSVFLALDSPDQLTAFHQLAKIAMMLKALKVPSERVAFVIGRGATFGWLNLNALPLEIQNSGATLFVRWSAMVTLFRAAANLPDGVMTLFGILGDLDNQRLTRDEFLDSLAERTGWNREEIAFLTGPNGFNLKFRADFADGQFLVRIKRCLELLMPLGVSAEIAWRWAAPSPNSAIAADIARAIKQAVRAKFDDRPQWLIAAGPIRDDLREQQRAALVAHLLHTLRIIIPILESPQPTLALGARRRAVTELQIKLNAVGRGLKVDGIFGPLTRAGVIAFQQVNNLSTDGIVRAATWARLNQMRQRLRGPNDLYAHFLMDVEMDPCMLTSRIVLATHSVQLFVQRCLLNLEPEVELTPEDAKEWAWMKNYRVWEANRKVFLYPENWIEPELRDDKTPFFVNLEHGLLQDEVNDSTVEREYLKYLQDLDSVAQLGISGLYRQWEVDRDILHVIGRTPNAPTMYYYRRWVDQRSWTPWERVDIAIEAEHVLPVVWNSRLYIFWPMLMENAQEAPDNDPENPRRHYEIRLAWSEYSDGKWSPKRESNEFTTTTATTKLPSHEDLAFWAQIDNEGRLYIFFGVHHDATPQLAPHIELFRFAECNGAIEAVEGLVTVLKIQTRFPGTRGFFNSMRGKATSNVLTAITGGEISTNEVWQFLAEGAEKTADVLLKTPGAFRLMVPHAERPFVSQSPFFYQDRSRTFFVAPRGQYVGGFSGSIDDLTMEPDTTHLELPDIITLGAARSLATMGTVTMSAPQVAPLPMLPAHWETKFFRFENFYHPYVCLLIEQINRHGIDGMLRPDPEQEPPARKLAVRSLRRQQNSKAFFNAIYKPNDGNVVNVHGLSDGEKQQAGPLEEFDFSYGGAYSIYNWELFFHAPFMLAKRLSANQRFAEADRWFHYIFDPTYVTQAEPTQAEPWPERVWQIKPFFEHGVGKSIERAMLLLKASGLSNKEREERKQLRDQIEAWRKTPFNPHLIARMRIEAYMKTVVMAYLDNLIAWGDQLFRQDTRESINEATQFYILADEILGERPKEIPAHESTRKTINGEEVKTFNQLSDHLDAFSNALIDLETIVYPMDTDSGDGGLSGVLGANDFRLNTGNGDGPAANLPLAAPGVEPPDNGFVLDLPLATPIPAVLGPTLFFCIPKNDKLLGYWDTVADRLFKIRHCMNTEGVVRQLSLFAPPIDPGLLVKAAAAGLDIGSVLSDLNAALPHYRFQVIAQKANEIIDDVKSLGAALLAALEKKDAEGLVLLRSVHEIQLVEDVRGIKEKRIEEEKDGLAALIETQATLELSREYYDTREFMSVAETLQSGAEQDVKDAQKSAGEANLSAALKIAFRPDISLSGSASLNIPANPLNIGSVGFSVGSTVGGSRAAAFDRSEATRWENSANFSRAGAIGLGQMGAWQRRFEEWEYQKNLAIQETKRVEKQIEAAKIRIVIAERDLQNHDLQIANAKAVAAYMHSKYTNQELYSWMASQISAVYFQSYQLAFDVARRAERAYRYELGLGDSNFIQFGYWDSLKKGLMAGERLSHDLKRMEVAYLDVNIREYELTKHVSLLQVNPLALLQLRATGRCTVTLPEALFDMDGPGHYFRRIKTVAVSIPCVTGPYASVNCTLTLLKSSIRKTQILRDGVYARENAEDERFNDYFGSLQSIVTSSAQNDSGLFETNLRDERYLPFENSGVVSEWQLELPANPSKGDPVQFDYNTISDVILHLRFTAREGGGLLRKEAVKNVAATIEAAQAAGSVRLFSIQHEFPTEWAKFHSQKPLAGQGFALALKFREEHYPIWSQGLKEIGVSRVDIFARSAKTTAPASLDVFDKLNGADPGVKKDTLSKDVEKGNLLIGKLSNIPLPESPVGEFEIFFSENTIKDLWIAVTWAGSV